MKLKLIASAFLGAVAVSGAAALKPESAEAQGSPFVFHCVRQAESGFATIVSNGSVAETLITWNSQAFSRSGYTPEVRCQAVTDKFNQAVQNGSRLRLSTGRVNGLGVICALEGRERRCNGDNLIITLTPGTNPRAALGDLYSAAAGGRPLAQSGTLTLDDWANAALKK